MKPSLVKILDILRRKKRRGFTFDDVPRGTEYRKRLMELRDMGYEMKWVWEEQSNGGRHKRWFLVGEPKRLTCVK